LQGVRVLELGQFIAGPYAGLQLADLGAEVIKIERPGSGDPFREFGIGSRVPGCSHNFAAFNRNKRSLALDINTPRGREVFLTAARTADVVVENFRAGVMNRLGLGADGLRAANPRLICCSIAGFAEDGPYRDRPAYDAVGQAVSGLLSLMVDPQDPRILGPTISDQVSGMQACLGILAALHERARSGVGARVEITMVEATLALIPDAFTAFTEGRAVLGPESRSAASLSFCFACGDDRLLAIHVSSTEKFWRGLLAAVERPNLGEDPRFVDRPRRVRNFQALVDELRPLFASRPRDAWMERLAAHDVPAATVNSIPQAMQDAEVSHLGMFHRLEHGKHGPTTAMHRAVRIDGAREAQGLPPPALGEHTEQVLRELGYAPGEIEALLRAGIAGAPAAS
jgi:crotonobetainyl-CoA:carnitine CoA-transferase CaiB-like acyl-CoA transferase